MSGHNAALRARPGADIGPRPRAGAGRSSLGLGAARDGLIHVPPSATGAGPLPLVVMFHGAGSSATPMLDLVAPAADAAGVLVVAPDSRATTWDVIMGGFGPDVDFIDRTLDHIFSTWPVDPGRVALGGFSDGASYALSLGLANGDVVTHVIAFSPGFMAPPAQVGRPRVYVSHGVDDRVLPIQRCSRRLVPALRAAEYDVTYEEFDGGHLVPDEISAGALLWFLSASP